MSTIDIKDFALLSQVNELDHLLISQAGGGAHGKMRVQLLIDAIKRLVPDGKAVNLRKNGNKLEWQHEGDVAWQELASLEQLKGDKGDTGPVGPAGPQGVKGEKGAQGAQGVKGERGLQGAQGAKGDSGAPLEFQWDGTRLGVRVKGDSAYQYVDLKGEKGADGTMTFEALTPEQKASLKGDKGDTGPTGPIGPQGIKGEKGAQGAQGIPGERGADGKDGKSAYKYAQESGYAGSEQELSAALADLARDKGSTSRTTLASLPTSKRLVLATLSGATDLSLAGEMQVGQELIISITATADFTQPLPVSGGWRSLDGDSVEIKQAKGAEISILCVASNNYVISCKS